MICAREVLLGEEDTSERDIHRSLQIHARVEEAYVSVCAVSRDLTQCCAERRA